MNTRKSFVKFLVGSVLPVYRLAAVCLYSDVVACGPVVSAHLAQWNVKKWLILAGKKVRTLFFRWFYSLWVRMWTFYRFTIWFAPFWCNKRAFFRERNYLSWDSKFCKIVFFNFLMFYLCSIVFKGEVYVILKLWKRFSRKLDFLKSGYC